MPCLDSYVGTSTEAGFLDADDIIDPWPGWSRDEQRHCMTIAGVYESKHFTLNSALHQSNYTSLTRSFDFLHT